MPSRSPAPQQGHYEAEIALTSALLGVVFAAGLLLRFDYVQLPLYGAALALFHFLEFWVTARYNGSRLTVDSFLIRNGRSYIVAHAFAVCEAVVEWLLFPGLKRHYAVAGMGAAVAAAGQLMRSAAMIQASSNFSHQIVQEREEEHALVTTGVYAVSRHPSYFGFFYWALGLQIFLGNPLSTVGFAVVLWRFFDSRIRHEEELLVQFFGKRYVAYRAQTPTRIPFIA